VHCPIGDTAYFAVKGAGAFKEESGATRRLTVSDREVPDLRNLLSVNHMMPYMHEVADRLHVRETVSVGSIGIKAGYIANNQADFYVTLGKLGEWDVCAPELILTEAGGVVTDIHGEPLKYGNENARIKGGLVLSNGRCHKDVLSALSVSSL
jgi:3'(2'), 5'-bisphosphate nucleotidase